MLRLDNQVAVHSSGSQLEWREVEGGQLPVPRSSPRATLVGETLFLTGGLDDHFTSPRHLDPVLGPRDRVLASSWQPHCAETLACGRCRPNFNRSMLIWNEFKTQTEDKDTKIQDKVLSCYVGAVSLSCDVSHTQSLCHSETKMWSDTCNTSNLS